MKGEGFRKSIGRKSSAPIESRDIIPYLTTISRRTLILADDERLFRVSYKIYTLIVQKAPKINC